MADVNIQFVDPNQSFGPFYVTQTEEWLRFSKAVDALPSTMRSLKMLTNDGSVSDTEELSVELEALESTNRLPEFAGLVVELRDLVGEGDASETAEIVGDE